MFVPPSSLIFLVIIAVWAAYFVQYWVRRREHLATAQSVDQFSETMRVLERRSPLPATDLSTPSRPSYAVSPARAVRAQVLVKRAATTTFTMTPSGAVTPGAAPVAGHAGHAGSDRSGGWSATVDSEDDGHSWDVESAAPVRPARAVRGLTLLAALAAFVIAVPLAAFDVLPWVGLARPARRGCRRRRLAPVGSRRRAGRPSRGTCRPVWSSSVWSSPVGRSPSGAPHRRPSRVVGLFRGRGRRAHPRGG